VSSGSQHTFDRSKVKTEAFSRSLIGCIFGISAKCLRPNNRDCSKASPRQRTKSRAKLRGRWQGIGQSTGTWHIFSRRDDGFTRCNRLSKAPAVVRLPRMAACGWLVPSKHLIIVFGMAVAHFRVVPGAPDVTLDPQILLPKLFYQTRKGSKQAFLHRRPRRTQALREGLVFLEDGCHPEAQTAPCAAAVILTAPHPRPSLAALCGLSCVAWRACP
jgi:hypothetical protein